MAHRRSVDLDAILDQAGNGALHGRDIHSLGPSDSSDGGSDMTGLGGLDSTSDRHGTGERASVEPEAEPDGGADISADAIVIADEAGLGRGLDQAEEAQLGITDEEIQRALQEQAARADRSRSR